MLRVASMLLVAVGLAAFGCASRKPVPSAAYAAQAEAVVQSATYHIGPADLLEIVVFDVEEMTRAVRVSDDGMITLPLVGSIPAVGKTPHELEAVIADGLRGRYMLDPHVNVQVVELRSRSIYVLGEVETPGAFPMTSREPITVLQALALGAGLTPMAAKGRALIIRSEPSGQRTEILVDIDAIVEGKAPDPVLRPNDIVFVPNSAAKTLARGFAEALVRMVTLGRIFN